jgi:organic radical activating enzyme
MTPSPTNSSAHVPPEKVERDRVRQVLKGSGPLGLRFRALRDFARGVRSSEFHLTNACNLRCKGCWFFAHGYDERTTDLRSLEAWRMVAKDEGQSRGITSALLIGGEPTLYLDRIAAFVESMKYVTISSNGLRPLPSEGFEKVAVALTLFGGGALDDELRGWRPSGERVNDLLKIVLENYKDDPRACFVFALAPGAHDEIEPTVRRIRDNGNIVSFNYYSSYGASDPTGPVDARILDSALHVKSLYPDTVVNDPYYIRALIEGETPWGSFGYASCPSISVDHPAHEARLANGNPVLPGFNTYAADGRTLNFCCTSGNCSECRDSQAVYSWLLVNAAKFMTSEAEFRTWIELAEGYWSQFYWSPFGRRARE